MAGPFLRHPSRGLSVCSVHRPSCWLQGSALPIGYYLVIFMELNLKEIWRGEHFLCFN